jgi:hypothetical protein
MRRPRTLLALAVALAAAGAVALPALSTAAATTKTVTLHRCTVINTELGRQGVYPYRMTCQAATKRIREFVFGRHLPKGAHYAGEGDEYHGWYCYAFMGTGGCFRTRGRAYGSGAAFHQPQVLNEGAPILGCRNGGCPDTLTTPWPPPLAS